MENYAKLVQELLKQHSYAWDALVLNPVLCNLEVGFDTSFDCWSEPNSKLNKQTLINDHIEVMPK